MASSIHSMHLAAREYFFYPSEEGKLTSLISHLRKTLHKAPQCDPPETLRMISI